MAHPDTKPAARAVFGVGGHGREIAWIAERTLGPGAVTCFVVDEPGRDRSVNGLPVMSLAEFTTFADRPPLIVGVGDSANRRRVCDRLGKLGLLITGLIDPSAIVSPTSVVAAEAVVFPGAILSANTVIGPHVHVNSACTLSHDVHVGSFTSLSPGTHLAGHVRVGEAVFFGVGADVVNGSVAQPLVVGDRAMIAAGACVIRDVPQDARVAGVPARSLADTGIRD